MSNLNIKLKNFEGPFDLLLHLIKKNKMNIYDIKIYDITNQYIEYLESMKEMDLELTSEFIVMAATLLEIKSKMLLPKPKIEEEEEDPRKFLMEKLIEYKKYKSLSNLLLERRGDDGYVFCKKPEIIEDTLPKDNSELLKNLTMLELYNIFNNLMNRYTNKINKTNVIERQIPIDKFKLEDKLIEVRNILMKKRKLKFSDLESICSCKMEVIVTFLAVLELMKEKEVTVLQPLNFDKIYIEGVAKNEYDVTV